MRCTFACLVLIATFAAPGVASARREPRVASDAFYVGGRFGPGSSLTATWDIDVYLSDDRQLSLGPGATIAVLGGDFPPGYQQDFQVAVDVLRFKVQVSNPGEETRPYFMLGGGFTYTHFPEEVVDLGSVIVDPDMPGMLVPVMRTLPEQDAFVGLMTAGLGLDLFFGAWGLALLFETRFRIGDESRLPEVWADLSIGIRFGL